MLISLFIPIPKRDSFAYFLNRHFSASSISCNSLLCSELKDYTAFDIGETFKDFFKCFKNKYLRKLELFGVEIPNPDSYLDLQSECFFVCLFVFLSLALDENSYFRKMNFGQDSNYCDLYTFVLSQ